MKQTLNMRQQINLRYCYSSRRPHKICRRPAVGPPLV